MQINKITNDKQKIIIISLIVSDKFCEKIVPILDENIELIYKSFSTFYRIILRWCIDYYKKYNQACHEHIADLFNDNKQSLKEDEEDLIAKFLKHLSDKYEREENYNESYVIDQSLKYIREVNLNILKKNIEDAQREGKIDEAEHLVFSYNKIERETEKRQSTNLFKDMDKAREVCDFRLNDNLDDRLFRLPGDIGKKLDWIYREDFFMLAGRGKIGKSFYLREIALIASLEYGLKVVVFNLEMSHDKYLRNFYQNISGETKRRDEKNIVLPYFEKNGDRFDIETKIIKKKGLSGKAIKEKLKITNIKTRGEIIIESFPSNTLYFNKMVKVLDDYLLDGFVTDLVLIDFLDNTKTYHKGEFRHGIDDKWVNARRLAQEKHIAVGTVSHTNISTFKTDVKPGSLSEDNRKYNHITHGVGINQTKEEKANQVSRLNIIANRDEDFNPDEHFLSLECRDIGRVLIDTKKLSTVNCDFEEED